MSGVFIVDTFSTVAGSLTRHVIRIRGHSDLTKFEQYKRISATKTGLYQPGGVKTTPVGGQNPVFYSASVDSLAYSPRNLGATRGADYAPSLPTWQVDRKRYTGYTGDIDAGFVASFSQLFSQVNDRVVAFDNFRNLYPSIAEINATVDDWMYGRGDGDWGIVTDGYYLAKSIFTTNPVLVHDGWVPLLGPWQGSATYEPIQTRGPQGTRRRLAGATTSTEFYSWVHESETSMAVVRDRGLQFCPAFGHPPFVEMAHLSSVSHQNTVTPTRTLRLYLVQDVWTKTAGVWNVSTVVSSELDSYSVPVIGTKSTGPNTSVTVLGGMKTCTESLGAFDPLANNFYYRVTCEDQNGAILETAGTGQFEESSAKTWIWHKKPPAFTAGYSSTEGFGPLSCDGEALGYTFALRLPLNDA